MLTRRCATPSAGKAAKGNPYGQPTILKRVIRECAVALLSFARLCGLVIALAMFAMGAYLLLTQPGELGGGTLTFKASKIGFVFVLFPLYAYGYFRSGSWLAGYAAAGIVLLWCVDWAFVQQPALPWDQAPALLILSLCTLGYALLTCPPVMAIRLNSA